jgi:hypothetical protein
MAQVTNNLRAAKKAKNDEFYTMLSDIEKELKNYKGQFKGKTVYLNCDDPAFSQFWQYFVDNFETLKIKHLIATYYAPLKPDGFFEWEHEPSYRYDFDGVDIKKTLLKKRGSFDSEECLSILHDEADIVVSNPPFSLFREYIKIIDEAGVKALMVGSQNAITYKNVFAMIHTNKLRLGHNLLNSFIAPDGSTTAAPCVWFTNLKTKAMKEEIVLVEKYSKKAYPKYVNLDAINVDKVKDIPKGYKGLMGVPITFLTKYNPNQFEIVGSSATLATACTGDDVNGLPTKRRIRAYMSVASKSEAGKAGIRVDGVWHKRMYDRIIIKAK